MGINDADATAAAYTLAPEAYGSLISQHRSGATSFHHFDALGSTERLTDNAATTLIQYLYRAFGQQSVLSGSSANRFTWVGKLGYYRQPDVSDYWVRARVLKPTLGRWLSRDPLVLRVMLKNGSTSWASASPELQELLTDVRRSVQPGMDLDSLIRATISVARKRRILPETLSDAELIAFIRDYFRQTDYLYSLNQPVAWVDPSGLFCVPCLIAGGVLIGFICLYLVCRYLIPIISAPESGRGEEPPQHPEPPTGDLPPGGRPGGRGEPLPPEPRPGGGGTPPPEPRPPFIPPPRGGLPCRPAR